MFPALRPTYRGRKRQRLSGTCFQTHSRTTSDAKPDLFDERPSRRLHRRAGRDSDWTAPDEEVFRLWIDEIREFGVHLMGRRLYETMLYWETADQDRSLDDAELEWTALWKPLPKVVFSNTLSVEKGNARLASHSVAEEIERLRAADGHRFVDRGNWATRFTYEIPSE
jgi:hypothetical protein